MRHCHPCNICIPRIEAVISRRTPGTSPITTRRDAPSYAKRHWAKSDRENPSRTHLLEYHLADVGACFEALMACRTIRQRLAKAGNRDDLDHVTVQRLAVLAALHDIGKANIGFQTRIWQGADLDGRRRPVKTGHTSPLVPVMTGADQETWSWFWNALGWEYLLQWDSDDGKTVCALFTAALSHHGAPLDLHDPKSPNGALWRPFGGLHPEKTVRRVGRLVREWFPSAFSEGPPLPSAPPFQHMFLGLCTLADWIGSDEHFFEFRADPDTGYMNTARRRAARAVRGIGLSIDSQRAGFPPLPAFGQLFAICGDPTPVQELAALPDAVPFDQRLVVIESETGSGKTEAALWRFARMYESGRVDGLYFALPTRAAASQIHRRVTRFASRMFPPEHGPVPVLAVPGYLRAGDHAGKHLPDYQTWWDDNPNDEARKLRWASENAKRYLAAQIAVGTVDQAMMAALQVKHSHMRAACLSRNLLVVDEVHASDPFMRAILRVLLDSHLQAGGYALLMSATLGSAARDVWLGGMPDGTPLDKAISHPYPAITTRERMLPSSDNGHHKQIRVKTQQAMSDFSRVAEQALKAARDGAKVLVIRNTVAHAVNTQQDLEKAGVPSDTPLLFSCRDVLTLHTGRFVADDRRLLDAEVETRLGKRRPDGGTVVVGTQTLEQSLDIDADLLITDLCPMDVLLQRIGRLHRHSARSRPAGYEQPTCVVLTPPGKDLSEFLTKAANANGLGGFVYPDLRVLEATRLLVVEHARAGTPLRIPEMNRDLVERATHPDALSELVGRMGEKWRVHANEIDGTRIADNLNARDVVVKRDLSFLDERVRSPAPKNASVPDSETKRLRWK